MDSAVAIAFAVVWARARPPASCTRPTHAPLCRSRDACNEHVNGNSVCPSSRQQRHLATRHCRLESGAWQPKCATLRIILHSRGWLLSDWLAALQTPVLLSICRLILCEHKLQTPTPTPPLLSSPNHPRFPDNTHVSDGECVALLSRWLSLRIWLQNILTSFILRDRLFIL